MTGQLTIQVPDGAFGAYVSRPSSEGPAPAVVVLHEVFGVNADMRETCDELADRGFVALCPDLFWRQEPGVDLDVRTPADWEHGLRLYQALDRDLAVDDVVATVAAARSLPGGSGRVGVQGFCLGALLAFRAAARTGVDAVVAYHGADTDKYLDEVGPITAPFLMHLAGADEFMPSAAQAAINNVLGRRANFDVKFYPGCNHAFARHNGEHYDADAADLANGRTWSFLRAHLRPEG